jgi:Family of unknown function (DUF5947)
VTAGLRRFREPRRTAPAGEVCEMCGEAIAAGHRHVVNVSSRALQCVCQGCHLLFTNPGAAGGKIRAVPDRYRHLPSFPAGTDLWESTGIPVRMAFFFTNSVEGRAVAFYPSPAGATESLLALDVWAGVADGTPELADLAPDVEALLAHRGEAGYEGFLVPIDACYELVGLVRMHWRGFDGGTEVWQAIDGYLAGLRARSGAR